MIGKLLRAKEKNKFCKELSIKNNIPEILLIMDSRKAKYFDGHNYYNVDKKIASKYI